MNIHDGLNGLNILQDDDQMVKPKKKFSKKQLRAGNCFLTHQTGTNRFASQTGMTSFGAVRHVSDIKVTQLYDEGEPDEYPTDEEDAPAKSSRASRRGERVDQEEEVAQDVE